eukprot:1157569-Pelagomonas_calceolata.AAC.4
MPGGWTSRRSPEQGTALQQALQRHLMTGGPVGWAHLAMLVSELRTKERGRELDPTILAEDRTLEQGSHFLMTPH